jgi:translocation and assembly module TamB
MRLLDPVLGYPFAPQGIAHLNLACAGEDGQFGIDGTVRVEKGAYIAPGVAARGVDLTARVHADAQHLRITSVVARLQQGGEIAGEVLLDHWLPTVPGQAQMHAAERELPPAPTLRQKLMGKLHRQPAPQPSAPVAPHSVLVKAPIPDLLVDGKVNAELRDVTVDTVLEIVSQPPFQRLGIASLLNGPANAVWIKGDANTLAVSANLTMSAENNPPRGEAPGAGTIDATYLQRDGSVDVRALDLRLPASRLDAQGRLGAYPLTSPTALNVDFHSSNLGEFDTVLRALGLRRNGKSGTAALPVALGGQADYHGTWSGSLTSPRLAGKLTATQLAMELPSRTKDGTPQWMRWDRVEATGSYDAEHIAIVHGTLQRGAAQIVVDGSLVAAAVPQTKVNGKRARLRSGTRGDEMPAFDSNSVVHAHVRAEKVDARDLLQTSGMDLSVAGSMDAQLSIDGPLHAPGGSGWMQLNQAVVYGEPVASLRVQGAIANRTITLSSIAARGPAGSITGSGSYDLASGRFEGSARSNSIDLAKIGQLQSASGSLGGKLEFTTSASGTLDEPHLQASGSIARLTVQGQPAGNLHFNTHTNGRLLLYDAGTQFDSAELTLHGQTEMRGDLATQARLTFAHFDIASLFKLAHVDSIKAQSSLVGSANLSGPLRRMDALQGDVRLEQAALTVAGVHLQSEGAVHATLTQGRLNLDPVHITGEGTDLRAQGSVELNGTRQMNIAADGSVNLKLAQTLDPDLTAGGTAHFQVAARGPLSNPSLGGSIDFQDGSLSLEDLPNGLSQLNGTLRFNQNRLEVVSLTAMTGGGKLTLGGYLAYQHGLFADVSVTGDAIRIRYPEGVSSLADAQLHLQGTPASLQLSGGIVITRFSVSPDLDIASLAARATAVEPVAPPNAPSNHVRLDVRIQSSPQLNFQNAYAKLAGDVDLRLRGTLATPSLQGRVSITEGNAVIAGTRYELQRGDVTFSNPVRIQPVIDLNATARVEDYDITLGLHGTPDKLTVTYRSDPPLPEADVVALLALGRTQSEQGLYTEQQQQSIGLSPSTDVLLGGALNATVSSRVQKLFGAGSVKVDPSYLGALGNSTTRITVEEQLGKNLTLTYATNVDTSAQQLLQAEIAVNRHVALLVTRDESGVFSMVIKATRRYR